MANSWKHNLIASVALAGGLALGATAIHYSRPADPPPRHLASIQPDQVQQPALDVKSIVQHGHIVEIAATTQPGVTVMINGEKAAVISDGSGMKHFVGVLPDGVNDITITVQRDDGDLNTKQLSVVMP